MRPDGYLLNSELPDPDVDAIIGEVARGFRVRADDILSYNRRPHITVARACAMAVVREATGLSFPAIGDYFFRHHTTVMHNITRVMEDPELSKAVRLVVDELSPPPRLFAVKEEAVG